MLDDSCKFCITLKEKEAFKVFINSSRDFIQKIRIEQWSDWTNLKFWQKPWGQGTDGSPVDQTSCVGWSVDIAGETYRSALVFHPNGYIVLFGPIKDGDNDPKSELDSLQEDS